MGTAGRAIGYVRVSKAREEMISPELQETAIQDWCARNNAHLLDVIADLDSTGRNFGRAGIQAAIGRVEDGDADLIVVWKWSRFGRNTRDSLVNIDRVEVAGGRVVAATEDFDDSPVGRFGRGQFLLMAQFESERIGEQWREAKARRVRMGLPPDGRGRFGYTYTDGAYLPDPATAPLLAGLYRRYTAGEPMVRIVDDLNRRGVPGPTGGAWWQTPLANLLDSGWGAGLILHRGQHFPGAHPPVITPAEWSAYQRARRQRAKVAPRHHSPSHPFTGLAKCGSCGRPLVRDGKRSTSVVGCAWRSGRPDPCPQRAWITVRLLDAEVVKWLAGVADEIDSAARAKAMTRRQRTADRAEVRRLAREVTRLETALARLTRQVAEGLVPAEAYVLGRDGLLRDLAARREALQVAEDACARAEVPTPGVVAGLLEDWPRMDDAGKRAVLGALVREIVVGPRRGHAGERRVWVTPAWSFPE
jgi:Site-specific recombinases, DNA invertase Pin homologs